ncbi:hypothetical protein ABIC75_001491 [Dyella japonica]|uniref:Uncharacterized protein n=1 Tax=Dyella japonica TaxID=231455 RepID=A0ABV2JV88_9GAMM
MRFFFDIGLAGVKKVTFAPSGSLFFRAFPDLPALLADGATSGGYGPATAAVSTIEVRFHARCCP